MVTPDWAKEVIELHDIFPRRGISIICEYKEGRVEAVCPEVDPSLPFPASSWHISEEVYQSGEVGYLLEKALSHIEDYLDATRSR